MSDKQNLLKFLTTMLQLNEDGSAAPQGMTNAAGQALPQFSEANAQNVKMIEVKQADGRLSQYPPPEHWDNSGRRLMRRYLR